MSRRVAMNLVIFGLAFVVMVAWAVNQIVSVDAVDHPYTLAAEFPNAVGLLPNAEVTYLGVEAGVVTQVERVPDIHGVRITLKMQDSAKIPDGSTANVYRKSAIGEQYVDFEPPNGYHGAGGPFYQPGTVIPMSHTTIPLEFSELLRSASAVIDSIDPNDVATLLHEAAVGLNGRSDSLRALTEAGDQLSATLAQHTSAIDRLASNGTALNHVLADHRDDLGQSLNDLRQLSDTLKNAKGDLSVVLDQGSSLLTQTANLVAGQKGNLDCDLKILENLTDETSTDLRLRQLAAVLDIGPRAFADVWDTRDVEPDGIWLRVGLVSNSTNPAPQFVPAKTVPPTRPVPACASPLRPVALDYTPAATTAPAAAPLARLGAVILLLVLTAGAALRSASVKVRSRR
jgi:phospholipid/cholesterol/gamma-HCH transport system substrate-binding protein